MLVSIIIVNYNGKRFLNDCLSSLSSITFAEHEVILVDNNSTDESIDFVKEKFPSVKIKQLEQNLGFAEANNIGANNSKGDLLLFLNNDTKVTESFLEPLVRAIQSNNVAICQSLLLKPDGTVDSSGDFIDQYGRAYNSKKIPKQTSPILCARGACMLVKKNIFNELGQFDKKFFVSFEDVDFGLRAWICGYDAVVVPDSIVYHLGSGTISKMKKEIQFHSTKNFLILRLANFETKFSFKSFIFLFSELFTRKLFNRSVLPEIEHNSPLPSSKIIFKAIIWIITNYNYISNKKKQLNSKRVRTTKDLAKLDLFRKIT
jgi:hypothetical protein